MCLLNWHFVMQQRIIVTGMRGSKVPQLQGALEESSAARAADTGWDDDAESQSSSASSTAGSDGSVSPELQRTASLLISRSLSLGGALLGSASVEPQLKPP